MSRFWAILTAAVAMALAATQPAAAGFGAYLERDCAGSPDTGISWERAARACTLIIQSGDIERRQMPYYLRQRGLKYDAMGDYEKAVADYDTAILITPEDFELYNDRCWANAKWGHSLFTALTDCNVSLQFKPGDTDTLDSRALVYFRRGEYADARADLDVVLAAHPKFAPSLYVRGRAKRGSGDLAGGDADIAAAKAIDPKIAETYAKYGVTP